jgi:hypothetical protein
MFEHQGSVLLILSQDVLDRVRVVAGKATAALKCARRSKAYPVTARDMTTKEKRRYADWKKR